MKSKLLIIEDDINILYSLQAKFSVEGFSVEICNQINDLGLLLNQIKLDKPGYIILDVVLPNIDGWEIIRNVKEDSDLKDIPFIVFTNVSDNDNKAIRSMLGVEYYFIKQNLIIDEFVDKVRRIIINRNKKI
jgi:DNA-binding response OmpR family regulator